MKKIVASLMLLMMISTVVYAETTKNEIKTKVKVFNELNMERQYGITYYRTLTPKLKVGVGFEKRTYKNRKDRESVTIECSIKF